MEFDVRNNGMQYTTFGAVTNSNTLLTVGKTVGLRFEDYELEVNITRIDSNGYTGIIINVEHESGLIESAEICQGSEINFKEENIFILHS